MTLAILGRQPAIGRAELESLYGPGAVSRVSDAIVRVDHRLDIARLGGTVKTAIELDTVNSLTLRDVVAHCKRTLPSYVANLPEGKIKLGLSLYGLEASPRAINAAALELKKTLRTAGRSVRVVPNTTLELSSAQTLHNGLVSPLGLELAFVRNGSRTIIAHVSGVQNIESYTLRDRGRPKRDARVGMLPPKLAQIIINLATSSSVRQPNSDVTSAVQDVLSADEEQESVEARSETYTTVRRTSTGDTDAAIRRNQGIVLDPFCGTGVVLQEALLMGCSVYGTDIETRMMDYSRANLDWLTSKFQLPSADFKLEVGDATTHTWHAPIDCVACEGYLGTPFASEPPEVALRDSIATCNLIMKKFLKNIEPQLTTGTRLCIAMPAWHVRGRVHHLPVLDDSIDGLGNLGYNRIDFEHARREDLVYHREDQIVGRELVVLVKM